MQPYASYPASQVLCSSPIPRQTLPQLHQKGCLWERRWGIWKALERCHALVRDSFLLKGQAQVTCKPACFSKHSLPLPLPQSSWSPCWDKTRGSMPLKAPIIHSLEWQQASSQMKTFETQQMQQEAFSEHPLSDWTDIPTPLWEHLHTGRPLTCNTMTFRESCVSELSLCAQAARAKCHRQALTTEIHLLAVLEARSLRLRCQSGRVLVRVFLLACRWPPSQCVSTQQRQSKLPGVSSYWGTNPTVKIRCQDLIQP